LVFRRCLLQFDKNTPKFQILPPIQTNIIPHGQATLTSQPSRLEEISIPQADVNKEMISDHRFIHTTKYIFPFIELSFN
jgi:hypothetical protein